MDFYRSNIPIIECDAPSTADLAFPPDAAFGCVERDYAKYPESMMAHPSEMEIVPESEWDARFDEQDAQKSSLEHLYLSGSGGAPAFVNLDQGREGDCATADTEVLTERGWVRWPDYNGSDLLGTVNQVTGALEFQPCLKKIVKEYDGPIVYSTNRCVDFGMTPNHRMYVRKWDEAKRTLAGSYSFVLAKDLGGYSGLMHAPTGFVGVDVVELEVPGDRRYDGDDFLAMLALVISDGYAGGSPSTRNWVSFCCFDERYQSVAALAARVGFKESPSRKGMFARYDAGALAEWIRQHCYTSAPFKSHTKKMPGLLREVSARQANHFLHWYGDRTRHDAVAPAFYTNSRRLADDIQELHLRVGKRVGIGERHSQSHESGGKVFRESSSFVLTVSGTDGLCLDRKSHIETDRYKGLVYCATVPNSTLVTRRNGSVLISGNCWAFSTGSAMMLDRLRRGLPMVRFAPHGVAAMTGELNGGWCGLSAKFAKDNGMPVEGNGPGEWPWGSHDRRYDTAVLRANMAAYKVEEDWYDLTRQVYNQYLTRGHLATCGFSNVPAPSDFPWWHHSVCQVRWVRIERGSWGPLILNSWKDWGRFGLAVLRGSQATAGGAVAIRLTSASAPKTAEPAVVV